MADEWIHLELYPFRYFDKMRGRWMRARYLAELSEIRARYERFEIIGPPWIRDFTKDPRIIGR